MLGVHIGRDSPLRRDPTSQLNSLSKFVFVYIQYVRGGPALRTWRDLAIDYQVLTGRRAGNFPYKRT